MRNTPTHVNHVTEEHTLQVHEHILAKHGQNTKTLILNQMQSKHETLILAKCGLAKYTHEKKFAKCGFCCQLLFWPNTVWPNAATDGVSDRISEVSATGLYLFDGDPSNLHSKSEEV